jgi:hypothetical protein
MSFGSNGVDRVRSFQKILTRLRLGALLARVRLVSHQLSCSNETVRYAPKHEF